MARVANIVKQGGVQGHMTDLQVLDNLTGMLSLEYQGWLWSLVEKELCPVCKKKMATIRMHLDHIGQGRERAKPDPRHFACILACTECHTAHHNEGLEKHYGWKQPVDMYKIALIYVVRFMQRLADG